MDVQRVAVAGVDRRDHPRRAVLDPREMADEGLVEDRIDGGAVVPTVEKEGDDLNRTFDLGVGDPEVTISRLGDSPECPLDPGPIRVRLEDLRTKNCFLDPGAVDLTLNDMSSACRLNAI